MRETEQDNSAILAALEGILRAQETIQSGAEVCVDAGLTLLHSYYRQLPIRTTRRLTELDPLLVASIPGTTVGQTENRQRIAEYLTREQAVAQVTRAVKLYRKKQGGAAHGE